MRETRETKSKLRERDRGEMAGTLSIVPSDNSNPEKPPLAVTEQWEIHYAHFFRFSPNNHLVVSSSTKLKPLPEYRFRNGGTWFAAASTATLQITSSHVFSPPSTILTVSLQGKIIEEHYTSSLQFSLLQVSSVTECPTKGSRVVLASYKDADGQIQKFAMRFTTSSHARTFINSLKQEKMSKSRKEPKEISLGEVSEEMKKAKPVFKKRKRKEKSSEDVVDIGVPSTCFTSGVSSESGFVTSNRLQCRDEEFSFVEPVPTSSPRVASILNYNGKQNECSQELAHGFNFQSISEVDMPPSFSVLLNNCRGEAEQEQVYVPVIEPEEENDLKSQIMRYMSDPAFHDILAKVDEVITEMGGFLEL